PFCNNELPFAFADYNFFHWVQMGHRFFAGILVIWTISLTIKMLKNYKQHRVMYYGWIITAILIILQAVFGAFVIFTQLNLWIAILHAFFITCYFGNLSYFLLLASRRHKSKELNKKENQKKDIMVDVQ